MNANLEKTRGVRAPSDHHADPGPTGSRSLSTSRRRRPRTSSHHCQNRSGSARTNGEPCLLRSSRAMDEEATILHADLDAFYASVEQLLQPNLRGKPIAVGGGVVLAASYEARAFGVKSGMSGRTARELCRDLIFTGGHF